MKSRIFIGSTVEGLDIAYAIQENLEHHAVVTVWDQDIFKPSNYALEDLEDALENYDHSIFVFSPDDDLILRGNEYKVARDNVLFELGLFIGKLGRENCFFVMPRGVSELRLATDLLGVNPLTYEHERPDGNLNASLGSVCNKIRKSLKSIDEQYLNVKAKYDIFTNKYPVRRAFRYLDTACIFPNRNVFDTYVGYSTLFESATSICGIGISLNAITVNWGGEPLLGKIKEGCNIKLLFLDPDGDSIIAREKEEKLPPSTIRNITNTSLALASRIDDEIESNNKDGFEYRLYDRPVSINMYIVNDMHIIVQHYIFDTRGQETPVFVINDDHRESGLFNKYKTIFTSIWNSAK